MSRMVSRIGGWFSAHFPTREGLEKNRWVRPFAHLVLRPGLWRFNRRSVPRGVALGLFAGILVPFAHSFIAAVSAVFTRANVPVAIVTTWSSNPFTWPLIFPGAIFVSGRLGLRVDMVSYEALRAKDAGIGEWIGWLLSDAAPALLFGLFVIATVLASVGYLATSFGWRWWVVRKRMARLQQAEFRKSGQSQG